MKLNNQWLLRKWPLNTANVIESNAIFGFMCGGSSNHWLVIYLAWAMAESIGLRNGLSTMSMKAWNINIIIVAGYHLFSTYRKPWRKCVSADVMCSQRKRNDRNQWKAIVKMKTISIVYQKAKKEMFSISWQSKKMQSEKRSYESNLKYICNIG